MSHENCDRGHDVNLGRVSRLHLALMIQAHSELVLLK